mmetsp:Transcript_44395/g.96464  ORF Transcript_44395/g.96464 Transcript_44395/m.96464 type:complete len:230 (+) Transcript_44395:426-1115(+)
MSDHQVALGKHLQLRQGLSKIEVGGYVRQSFECIALGASDHDDVESIIVAKGLETSGPNELADVSARKIGKGAPICRLSFIVAASERVEGVLPDCILAASDCAERNVYHSLPRSHRLLEPLCRDADRIVVRISVRSLHGSLDFLGSYVRVARSLHRGIHHRSNALEGVTPETLLLSLRHWSEKELLSRRDQIQSGRVELVDHPMRQDIQAIRLSHRVCWASYPRLALDI